MIVCPACGTVPEEHHFFKRMRLSCRCELLVKDTGSWVYGRGSASRCPTLALHIGEPLPTWYPGKPEGGMVGWRVCSAEDVREAVDAVICHDVASAVVSS